MTSTPPSDHNDDDTPASSFTRDQMLAALRVFTKFDEDQNDQVPDGVLGGMLLACAEIICAEHRRQQTDDLRNRDDIHGYLSIMKTFTETWSPEAQHSLNSHLMLYGIVRAEWLVSNMRPSQGESVDVRAGANVIDLLGKAFVQAGAAAEMMVYSSLESQRAFATQYTGVAKAAHLAGQAVLTLMDTAAETVPQPSEPAEAPAGA